MGMNRKEHKERKEMDATASGMRFFTERARAGLSSLCSLRSLRLVPSRLRANQALQATAARLGLRHAVWVGRSSSTFPRGGQAAVPELIR